MDVVLVYPYVRGIVMRSRARSIHAVLVAVILLSALALPSLLVTPASAKEDPLTRTWARTDWPVKSGAVNRTWMWGPERFKDKTVEEYTESPGGQRTVLYWDKSRMEITHPDAHDDGVWYVTNGLLVWEMITGQLQVGDHDFEPRSPARVNVAGDLDDPNGPTFATFGPLLDAAPYPSGSTITTRVDRNGNLSNDASLASYGVTAASLVEVPGIRHQIASPFWQFMTSQGTIYEDSRIFVGPLFQNAFYATGYPLTEAYWANVKVGGTQRDVLMQCFERRCLTYTPGNDAGWQVEAGNVGIQYYTWRYEDPTNQPPTDADDERTLQTNQPLTGAIDPQTDIDTYYFNAAAGQRVSIWVTSDIGGELDGVLSLYAPDGTLVNNPEQDDDLGLFLDPRIYNLPMPVSGRYKLIFESYSAMSSGGYSIALLPDDGAPTEGDNLYYSPNLSDWSVGESDQTQWFTTENSYHIRIKPNNAGFVAWDAHGTYSNVSASIFVRRVSGPSNSSGCLIVRSGLQGGADGSTYRLCVQGDSRATFADYSGWQNGAYSEAVLLPFQERDVSWEPGDWNLIKIMASGNRLWFYINDILVGSATHNGPFSGQIGVQVHSRDNNAAEYEFAQLIIRAASGP
jgi:hypothetical protein